MASKQSNDKNRSPAGQEVSELQLKSQHGIRVAILTSLISVDRLFFNRHKIDYSVVAEKGRCAGLNGRINLNI